MPVVVITINGKHRLMLRLTQASNASHFPRWLFHRLGGFRRISKATLSPTGPEMDVHIFWSITVSENELTTSSSTCSQRWESFVPNAGKKSVGSRTVMASFGIDLLSKCFKYLEININQHKSTLALGIYLAFGNRISW